MPGCFNDRSLAIGSTPLVRLNRVTGGAKAAVLAKIERPQSGLLGEVPHRRGHDWDAETRGLLEPGKSIVEPTSGNAGIALVFVTAARGYPITLTMPDTMSVERRKLLIAYCARLVLTEGAKGMKAAIAKAKAIAGGEPEHGAPSAVQEPGQTGHS